MDTERLGEREGCCKTRHCAWVQFRRVIHTLIHRLHVTQVTGCPPVTHLSTSNRLTNNPSRRRETLRVSLSDYPSATACSCGTLQHLAVAIRARSTGQPGAKRVPATPRTATRIQSAEPIRESQTPSSSSPDLNPYPAPDRLTTGLL